MDEKLLSVPRNRFDKIVFSAKLSESISNKKITKEEIMKIINCEELILTEEQKKLIDEEFL